MDRDDYDQFFQVLEAAVRLISRGRIPVIEEPDRVLWWRLLAPFALTDVQRAISAHCGDRKAGKFPPVPADILDKLASMAANDGRPGPEEAWAIALGARDEGATIVWTSETRQAFAIASTVLEAGDEVGARMAFREAYARLVDDARALRQPATWSASLGHDPERRAAALALAVDAGRIDAQQYPALPSPREPVVLLAAPERLESMPAEARAALLALRVHLAAGVTSTRSEDGQAKQRTADLKAAAQRRVDEYEARA